MSKSSNKASASSSLNPSTSQQQGSRRWTHFHSALQLAIQRASHKWTYDDFCECFDLWCKEQPDGASGVYNTISNHMEKLITDACDELCVKYNARENIDILHAVVVEAQERQKAGIEPGADTWRADLEPRAAVRARTIPVLREEKARAEAKLAELEKENLQLQAEFMKNYKAMKANEAEEKRRYDLLDELTEKWSSLPIEDIQDWSLRTVEALPSEPAV